LSAPFSAPVKKVTKALHTQIIDTVAEHFEDLYYPTLGYDHVSCLSLLTHLSTNHGKIIQDELDANQLRMQAPWHPPTPIKALFTQLNAGIRFATTGNDAPSAASVTALATTSSTPPACSMSPAANGAENPTPTKPLSIFAATSATLTKTTDTAKQ
jgi:hypothetical protein